MKTIIAGTDFSASSVNACEYAAFLAQKLNCKLTIFNMFEAPIIHSNVGLYGISYTSQRRTSLHNTNKLVNQLKKVFPKIKIDYFVTFGNLKQELRDFVSVHKVEAAVMGLESKDKISKFIYGSRGVNLAGKIDCPVIIVPSKYKVHKLSKILLAVDNNEKLLKSSLSGLEKFVKQAKTNIALLHARTEDEIFDPVITNMKFNGKKLPIEVIKAKDIQDGVKKYCAGGGIDLVTILSKRHSVFYNLFSESHTKKVAFATRIPVMAIHE
ncbi:MAG TPA: universal stress protein [Bacteroidia bacterium]|jgi:nucleotide-binding universal stress UspA family protein|nr:universal stress protein [Bacteroidia bacterium]